MPKLPCWTGDDAERTIGPQKTSRALKNQKNDWPQMNADEHRLKTNAYQCSSVFICGQIAFFSRVPDRSRQPARLRHRGMRTTLISPVGSVFLASAQEKSALLGIIRDAQTQQPIQGAQVYLVPYALRLPDPLFPTLQLVTDSFIGFQTTTDAAGRYRFADLPAHRYCLGTSKQGYGYFGDMMCQVDMVRTITGRSVERDLAVARAARLRVRFVDRDTNAPVDGLSVNRLQHEYSSGFQQWTTIGAQPGKTAGEFEVQPGKEFYLEIIPDDTEKIAVRPTQSISTRAFYEELRSYYWERVQGCLYQRNTNCSGPGGRSNFGHPRCKAGSQIRSRRDCGCDYGFGHSPCPAWSEVLAPIFDRDLPRSSAKGRRVNSTRGPQRCGLHPTRLDG